MTQLLKNWHSKKEQHAKDEQFLSENDQDSSVNYKKSDTLVGWKGKENVENYR